MSNHEDRHAPISASSPNPSYHQLRNSSQPTADGNGSLRRHPLRTPGQAPGSGGDRLYALDELIEAYDAAEDMEPVVERMAWPRRITLLAGEDKIGKSTLVGAAVASVSKGNTFLSETRTDPGTVLYLSLDEDPGELGKRLAELDTPSERFHARISCLQSPLELLEQDVRELEPDLIVVDSLTALARHPTIGRVNATDWTGVMRRLRHILRIANSALILLHHARKSDGRLRGSTEIPASADVVLEMFPGRSETERRSEARARWPIENFRLVMVPASSGYRYELTGPEGLEHRVCRFLQTNSGASTREVRIGVSGRHADIRDALDRLEEQERIANGGEGNADAWYLVDSR